MNYEKRGKLEKIRDFIILHYHATQRDDSPFWQYCRDMSIPDSLAHRIALFKEGAHAFQTGDELFRLESWTHVMLGQGIVPESYNHIVANLSDQQLASYMAGIRQTITRVVERLPGHAEFLRHYCPSDSTGSSAV